MKTFFRIILTLLLVFALLLPLVACGNSEGAVAVTKLPTPGTESLSTAETGSLPTETRTTAETPVETTVPPAERVAVSGAAFDQTSLTLGIGQTAALSAHVLPLNATNQKIIYTVSDPSVISYADGVVTALAAGSATVKAETDEDGYIARCSVTVTDGRPTDTTTPPVSTTTPVETTTPPVTTTPVITTTPVETPTPAPTTTPVETTTPVPTTTTPVETTTPDPSAADSSWSITPNEPKPKDYTPFLTEEKVVAFTFDDGPDWWTSYILDVIDGTEDKVSFFITGYMMNYDSSYVNQVRRALSMGCDVGIHAYWHEKNVYFKSSRTDSSYENFVREVVELDRLYESNFGVRPQLYRPQGDGFNPYRNYGYALILWNVDSLDWETYDNYTAQYGGSFTGRSSQYDYLREQAADEIVNRILSEIKPGDIVLMHDVFNISRMAFAKIYPILKEMGYKLVSVTELLGINPEEHHGQYFFSTGHYGYNGNEIDIAKSARSRAFTAPPKKKEDL